MDKPKIGDVFQFEFSFTESQILTFAEISGDTNPVHVVEEYGSKSIFKSCIVHGFFSISVFSKAYGTLLYPDEHILISQNARYFKPIYTGKEYSAVFKTLKVYPSKNRVLYLNEIFEIETGELKVSGKSLLMNKKHYRW